MNYLPGLSLNHDTQLPSSQGYRCELLAPTYLSLYVSSIYFMKLGAPTFNAYLYL
jgi:hypothetical protein